VAFVKRTHWNGIEVEGLGFRQSKLAELSLLFLSGGKRISLFLGLRLLTYILLEGPKRVSNRKGENAKE
jgi:hypothetical protein